MSKKKKVKEEKPKEEEIKGIPNQKKKWAKKDFADYFKESRELSDFTCKKGGIVESRRKKMK